MPYPCVCSSSPQRVLLCCQLQIQLRRGSCANASEEAELLGEVLVITNFKKLFTDSTVSLKFHTNGLFWVLECKLFGLSIAKLDKRFIFLNMENSSGKSLFTNEISLNYACID